MKGSRIAAALLAIMAVVLPCTGSTFTGGVMEGVDVPEEVLTAAKTQVKQLFDISRTDFPHYNYTGWRIETLAYAYTYDDLNGIRLAVYQMNYEFLAESPGVIVLAGGLYIAEDNWVMSGNPSATYLIFLQDGGELSILQPVVENDCTPETELFTEDLMEILARYQ